MYCENCGHELKDQALFCDECGFEVNQHDLQQNVVTDSAVWMNNPMDTSYQTASLPRVGQKRHIKLIAGIAAAAVVLAGAFFLLFLKKRPNGFQFTTNYHLYDASYDYIIMTDDNDHYGVLDFKGEVVIPFEYDKMEFLDKNEQGKKFMIRKNDQCGIINHRNELVLRREYDLIGYFSDYDLIYAIDLSGQCIKFFNQDGKVEGNVDHVSTSKIMVVSQFIQTSRCNIYSPGIHDFYVDGCCVLNGMLSSDYFLYYDGENHVKVVNIKTQETVLEKDADYQILRFIDNGVNNDSFYRLRKLNYINPDGTYSMDNILINERGQEVQEGTIVNSKGKELAEISYKDYLYVKQLDDNGMCLITSYNDESKYALKNIVTGKIIAEFVDYSIDEENRLITVIPEKITSLYPQVSDYSIYSFSGKLLIDYNSLFGSSSKNQEINEVPTKTVIGTGGIFFRFYKTTVDPDGFSIGFISSTGKQKIISENSVSFYPVSYTAGFSSLGYTKGNYLNVRYGFHDKINKYVEYYYDITADQKIILINDNGDILTTFDQGDWFKPIIAYNNDGICLKINDNIYWYNRTDKPKGRWNLFSDRTGKNAGTKTQIPQTQTAPSGSQNTAATTVPTTAVTDAPDTTTQTTNASQQSSYNVGQEVVMGEYEQDNNFSNGKEPLKWTVLDVQGDKALLIARDLIDYIPYHERRTDITWEDCTLRKWMNGDFYETAFSTQEQSRILTTHLTNHDNVTGTDGGNDTDDRIFALSVDEANRYFASDAERVAYYTDYVESYHYVTEKAKGREWWWLRSPGVSPHLAALVNVEGEIIEVKGDYVEDYDITVRPAMWISI